jgi:hypothetical protein
MHEYDRNRRRYYFYFENALIFTSSDGARDVRATRGAGFADARLRNIGAQP